MLKIVDRTGADGSPEVPSLFQRESDSRNGEGCRVTLKEQEVFHGLGIREGRGNLSTLKRRERQPTFHATGPLSLSLSLALSRSFSTKF